MLVSYPKPDEPILPEEEQDYDQIDISTLDPMRSSRHVFVSHLIRIGQIQSGEIEQFEETNFQQQLLLELQQASENQMKGPGTFSIQKDNDEQTEKTLE